MLIGEVMKCLHSGKCFCGEYCANNLRNRQRSFGGYCYRLKYRSWYRHFSYFIPIAKLSVKGEKYNQKYDYLNSKSCTCISIYDFIRATLTLGSLDSSSCYKRSFRLHSFRLGACLSAISLLEFDGNLKLNKDYNELDLSEKIFVNYWYGMIFTKIVAEQIFLVPWLGFVDNCPVKIEKDDEETKSRPDYVGLDINSGWHVFEAKGTKNKTKDMENRAITQAKMIKKIANKKPKTSNACIAELSASGVKIYLYDPVPDDDEHNGNNGDNVEGDHKAFLKAYYQSLISFIIENDNEQTSFKVGEYSFIGRKSILLGNEITIALPQEIIKYPEAADRFCKQLFETDEVSYDLPTQYSSIGLDGVLVFSKKPFEIVPEEVSKLSTILK